MLHGSFRHTDTAAENRPAAGEANALHRLPLLNDGFTRNRVGWISERNRCRFDWFGRNGIDRDIELMSDIAVRDAYNAGRWRRDPILRVAISQPGGQHKIANVLLCKFQLASSEFDGSLRPRQNFPARVAVEVQHISRTRADLIRAQVIRPYPARPFADFAQEPAPTA